nr:helix-hairpin-helix domain-containing protein [Myxococcota bacterium]
TELLRMVKRVSAAAVAVGNGTWGREAAAFARKVLIGAGMGDVMVVPVSESGASVYSASDVARDEFPDLDLTVRGAISIARRLQDPLAELVKVEPRSLGVGQYQHDVDPALLAARLDEVVEDCVNAVGVDLNTASAPLLSRVAGIGPALSKAIVKWRETAGPFAQRSQLLKVPRLGPATFTQCAGFLRIRDARNPLDSSAVHPERYGVVAEMARDLGRSVAELVGNAGLVSSINLSKYVDKGNEDAVDRLGMPTLVDIAAELTRPGRDPRSSFEAPAFKDDVREIEDLEVGMVLEGIVTNVAAFGAFVDIGVHQDGLVHVSELSDSFVRNPSDVVRTGQKVVVKVKEVDARRRRISLTMKGLRDVSRGDGE